MMPRLLLILLLSCLCMAQSTNIPTFGVTYANLQVADPTVDNGTNTYNNDVSVTISDGTSGAAISYCTNAGADCSPGTSYTTAVSITATTTHLCAKATKTAYTDSNTVCWTYTLTAADPTYSHGYTYSGAAITSDLAITTSTTGGSVLYYSSAGTPSTPSCPSTGTTYSTPLSVATSTNYKAIACKSNYTASAVKDATYTISAGTISRVGTTQSCRNTNSCTTSASDTTGATLLVMATQTYLDRSASAPSDSKGNTWTPLADCANPGNNLHVQLWYVQNPTVGTGHTFSSGNAGNTNGIQVQAYSGTLTSGVFQTSSNLCNGSDSATTIQPGSVTPASNGYLIVTAAQDYQLAAMTVDSPFTLGVAINTDPYGGFADYIQSTAAAINPTWNANATAYRMASTIAVFKK